MDIYLNIAGSWRLARDILWFSWIAPACCAGVTWFKPSTIQQFDLLAIPTLKSMQSFTNIYKIILWNILSLLISHFSGYSAKPEERVEFGCHAPYHNAIFETYRWLYHHRICVFDADIPPRILTNIHKCRYNSRMKSIKKSSLLYSSS